LRARALRRRLADALESRPRRRRGDLLRLALCRLDAGDAPGADLLLTGALEAEQAARHGTAERLARAALDAGGGIEAGCLLARSLLNQGSIDEAGSMLVRLGSEAATPSERDRVARDRAAIFVHSVSRALVAPEIVDEQFPTVVGGEGLGGPFDPIEAVAALTSGRPQEVLLLVQRLRAWPEVDDVRLLWAAVMATVALALQGRTEEALKGVEHGLELAGTGPDDPPDAVLALLATRSLAFRLAGRLAEAEAVAEEGYQRALLHENIEARGSCSVSLGKATMARGRVRRSLRLFREAAALARGGPCPGQAAWALANLATAAAIAGEPEVADDALAEAVSLEHALPGIFATDLALARAWVAAVAGEASRGVRLAREAATMAESRGQDALAAVAWHDVARLGRPEAAAEPLDGLAARLDGGLVAAYTPALRRTGTDHPLTPREWEVATLAARGLSNRQVATRLFVSLRTVENHLHRVFSKLGIASRRELRSLVESTGAAP
jgi:DNA-binding CsgD family transcriptional regulator/tetratricopeptide (TPR) repeat protein